MARRKQLEMRYLTLTDGTINGDWSAQFETEEQAIAHARELMDNEYHHHTKIQVVRMIVVKEIEVVITVEER